MQSESLGIRPATAKPFEIAPSIVDPPRIRRSANAQVVFRLSGRMGLEETVELETLIKSEENGRPIVLDLKDVTLVGQDAIAFLARCEADNITLKNCAAYVREWITRQRESS